MKSEPRKKKRTQVKKDLFYNFTIIMTNKKRCCVLVDDDDDDQLIFRTTVNKSFPHYKFNGFLSADQLELFFESSNASDVEIIFLDLNMPKTNGIEVLESLKKSPDTAQIPVVIYSTSNNPNDVNQCLMRGADAFITKPSKIKDLEETLKVYLND